MGKVIPGISVTTLKDGYIKVFDPWLKAAVEVPNSEWVKIAIKEFNRKRALKMQKAEEAKQKAKSRAGKQGEIDFSGYDSSL